MTKTEAEWKQQLSPEEYRVIRKKGTEAPFSGEYDNVYVAGTYTCAACDAELFESDTKYDAHCGWPSFYDAKQGAVTFTTDDSLGMARTEVTCTNCGGHLGHVFEGEGHDTPTDQRYCINSVSLKLNK